MASLKGVIDRSRIRRGVPPAGRVSVRHLLSQFSLTPALSVRALLASDLIGQRFEQDGGAAGPLGIPMGNVTLTPGGEARQAFSGGQMTVKDGKVSPSVAYEAEVRFLGFRCNEEADHDQSTPSDEPYFVIAVTGKTNTTKLYGPFDDVDGGESRFTTAGEDIVATGVQPPFTISVLAMENDEGTPSQAASTVKEACEDAIRITQSLAVAFGQAQVAVVTVMLNTVFSVAGKAIGAAASAVLGLGDDVVGSRNERIGDWNDGAEEWATTPRLIENPAFSPSPYNLKIDVGDDDEGKYTLYFNVNIFVVTRVPT